METSASELVNYRGDAAAALGSSEGAASGANTIYGNTDATRINQVDDSVAQANLQKNIILYNEKIKNRNKLFDGIEKGDLEVNQMLSGDRARVMKEFYEPMKKMLVDDPDLRNDPKKWVQYSDLKTKFEEAKKYAGTRYLTIAGMDKEIAGTTDPQKKDKMLAHRNAMENQDLFQEVKPYQQMLDFSDGIFAKATPKTQTMEQAVGDQVVTTTYSHTPVRDFINGVLNNSVNGDNKTLADEMLVYANQVHDLGDEQKAALVERWNEVIGRAMADEKLKKGDADWIEPIQASIDKKSGEVVVAATPQQMVLAASLLKNYSTTSTSAGKISNLPSVILKNREAAMKDLTERKLLIPAKVATEYARRAKLNADADKARQETLKLKDGTALNDNSADYYINTLAGMFDEAKYSSLPDFKSLPGNNTATFNGKVLMGQSAGGQGTYSVLSDVEKNALGRRVQDPTSKKMVIELPDAAVLMSDKKNPQIATLFYPKNEEGDAPDYTKRPEIMFSTPQALVQPLVKGVIGESASGNEYKVIDNVMNRYKNRVGTQNINGTISGLKLDGTPDEPAPAGKAASTTPKAPPVISDTTLSKKKSFFGKKK